GARSGGTWAIIWKGDCDTVGAATPLTSTALSDAGPARPLPKMAISPPGAIPGVNVAPLRMPPAVNVTSCGARTNCTAGLVALIAHPTLQLRSERRQPAAKSVNVARYA